LMLENSKSMALLLTHSGSTDWAPIQILSSRLSELERLQGNCQAAQNTQFQLSPTKPVPCLNKKESLKPDSSLELRCIIKPSHQKKAWHCICVIYSGCITPTTYEFKHDNLRDK
jgi:hypothetical protein